MNDDSKSKADVDDADRLYPKTIIDWELEHGIAREMRNGAMYIRCTDFDAFNRKLADEREARRLARLKQRIAEEQAAAYFGTGG